MDMIEKDAKNFILFYLRIGGIQPFQIEEHLRRRGFIESEIGRIKKEILEAYNKEKPRY